VNRWREERTLKVIAINLKYFENKRDHSHQPHNFIATTHDEVIQVEELKAVNQTGVLKISFSSVIMHMCNLMNLNVIHI
jgi:protein involved in sex pheromone biosynthesis